MVRLVCVACVFWSTSALAQQCKIPEIQLMSVNPGERFDVDASVRVAQRLLEAAHRDVARAGDGKAALGAELIRLGEGVEGRVAPALLALAVRLRQLDCAVQAGRGDPALYAEIIDGTRPYSVPPRTLLVPPPVPRPPVNARRRAIGYGVGGGALLIAGAGLLATGIAFSVFSAQWHPDPPCTPQDLFCFNGLDELAHTLEVEVAIVGVGVGAAATVAGSVLASRSAHWAHHPHLKVSIGPRSAFAGVQLTF